MTLFLPLLECAEGDKNASRSRFACGAGIALRQTECRPFPEESGRDDIPRFFFQAEDGIRDTSVTGVQTCALPISAEANCQGGGPRNFSRGTRAKASTSAGDVRLAACSISSAWKSSRPPT